VNKFLLTFIRLCFSLASLVSPKLAGRLAFRLFCTTFKVNKKSPQIHAILAQAQEQFAQAKPHLIAYSGGTIAAFEFKPIPADHAVVNDTHASAMTKTVLLVHGWQSHSGFMQKFIAPLQQAGFRVITLDLPGHGQSSGRTFHLPLGVEAINAACSQLGGFDVVISHSLGGAVMGTALSGTLPDYPGIPVSKIVLISSPNSMAKIFNDFSTMVGLNTKANAALHNNVTRLSGRVTDDFNVASQLQSVNADILIMHAPDDKEVLFTEAQAIAQANASALLKPMPGLGHRRIIADDTVVAKAVEFICS